MKKHLLTIGMASMVGFLTISSSQAQINACNGSSNPGHAVNATEFGNAVYGIAGDLTVVSGSNTVVANDPETADWYIASTAIVDVYAAVIIPTGKMVTVKSGATLNIYGNMLNQGILNVEPGATINFYGSNWSNSATASVKDGATTSNLISGGNINFISVRPAIPASYLAAGTCSVYSGGNFTQELDGGNIPMDIKLHVRNANNIQLVNTNTVIEGEIVFNTVNGDINLGNNNLVFTSNGRWSTNVAVNDAYFITNGTNPCAGAVEKKGLAPNASFTFAIGRAEIYSSGRDFTPVVIRNDANAADDFQVRVKNYVDATTIGGVIIKNPQEGMDRAWQITSANGSGVTLGLQHNSSTNGTDYTNVFGGDPNAFITQYLGNGNWSSAALPGSVPGSAPGSVPGSVVHTQGFSLTTTATNCTDARSWFTKTPDVSSPLPVELMSFDAYKNEQTAHLEWATASEYNNKGFEIERSIDGKTFTNIGFVNTNSDNGNSRVRLDYQFTDNSPENAQNFYRLKQVDFDGKYEYSPIRIVGFDKGNNISIFPNPATESVNISNLKGNEQILIYDATGRLLNQMKIDNSKVNIPLGKWNSGVYYINILNADGNTSTHKLLKK